MNGIEDVEQYLRGIKGPRFISVTHLSKSAGELARYTMAMGVDYSEVCQKDITELEIQLQTAHGIEAAVIQSQIASLKESILARQEGREHVDYTKKGIYEHICPGIKKNLNDGTYEICGFQHAKKVLIAGNYKAVNHRSEETALKAKLRKSLKVGKFKTLPVDKGFMKKVKFDGETIDFSN